jgi:hypothetical protein
MAGLRPVKIPVRALIREPGPPFTGIPIRCRDSAITNVASLCRGQQGELSVTGQLTKMGESGGALWIAELGAIAVGEFGVPVRIMAIPHSQLCGGRDLLAQSSKRAAPC